MTPSNIVRPRLPRGTPRWSQCCRLTTKLSGPAPIPRRPSDRIEGSAVEAVRGPLQREVRLGSLRRSSRPAQSRCTPLSRSSSIQPEFEFVAGQQGHRQCSVTPVSEGCSTVRRVDPSLRSTAVDGIPRTRERREAGSGGWRRPGLKFHPTLADSYPSLPSSEDVSHDQRVYQNLGKARLRGTAGPLQREVQRWTGSRGSDSLHLESSVATHIGRHIPCSAVALPEAAVKRTLPRAWRVGTGKSPSSPVGVSFGIESTWK